MRHLLYLGPLTATATLVVACQPALHPAYAVTSYPHAAGASTGYASPMMAGMKAIDTVPAEQAPKPGGGPGWYCFEYRAGGATRSVCGRSRKDCRAAAARHADGSTVPSCSAEKTASCTHLWFDGAQGEDHCAITEADCKAELLTYTQPGGAVRQSACGEAP